MTAPAPAEPTTVARACPTCGKELPPGMEPCPSCDDGPIAPGTRLCPVCAKELPFRAQKCLACGEYVNWKGRLTSAKALVTFVVTTTAAVIGIVVTWGKWASSPPAANTTSPTTPVAISRTKIVSFDVREKRLAVLVRNDGTTESRVLRDFRLYIDEPDVLEFGPLNLLSQEKAVPAGGTVTLDVEITYIKPRFDVFEAGFWTRYGARPVTLTGTVVESDDTKRELKKQMPLEELKAFVQSRSDPPPPRSGRS